MKPVVNLQEKKIIIYLDNILILSLSIIGAFKLGNIHGRYRFIHFISKIKRNFVNTLFKLSDGKVQKKIQNANRDQNNKLCFLPKCIN